MLPNDDDEISVISIDTESTIEIVDNEDDIDMPPLIPLVPPHYPDTVADMAALLFLVNVLANPVAPEAEEAYEHLERVWDLLVFCADTQEPIERRFDVDISDYVSGEDFSHQEIGYQLDDCEGQPLKWSTLETMIREHRQYKNPRTRSPILYFTKVRVLTQ
jgi:hypothetical protein